MGQSVYSPSLNRYAQGFFQTYFTQSDNDDDKQRDKRKCRTWRFLMDLILVIVFGEFIG